jgi:chromosome segregation ATPase
LSGIVGRLGDLGSAKPELDVAISNSTPALDNIVVRSEQECSRVLKFLRDNKIGVATLICLDKIQGLRGRMDRPFACPKPARRLFDQVEAESD